MTHDRDPTDRILAPLEQERPADEDPEGEDPLLVAARWTLQGRDTPEGED